MGRLIKSIKKSFNYIKETITYYIVNWYTDSWFYYNINLMVRLFKQRLSYCTSKEKALLLIHKSQFKYISNKYKLKLINEKFKGYN